MKKFTTRLGYIAYTCTAQETTYLGGIGICDDCVKLQFSVQFQFRCHLFCKSCSLYNFINIGMFCTSFCRM